MLFYYLCENFFKNERGFIIIFYCECFRKIYFFFDVKDGLGNMRVAGWRLWCVGWVNGIVKMDERKGRLGY